MNDDPANLFGDDEPRAARPGIWLAVLAALALALAAFALWRGQMLNARIGSLVQETTRLTAIQADLEETVRSQAEREARAEGETRRQLETLLSLSRDVAALEALTAEIQDRSALPQRTWARAEALALLELANRQLSVERDVDAAIDAMTAADARLAELREPVLNTVRRQLTTELETLRAFPRPDLAGMTVQLREAEVMAASLAVRGIIVGEPPADAPGGDAQGLFSRARQTIARAFDQLVTVRRAEAGASGLLTEQERTVKRQRLQLLLLGARVALLRGDPSAFRGAVDEARTWLADHFDPADPAVERLDSDLAILGGTDIAPPLPDISGSLRLMRQLAPLTRTPA